MNTEPLKGTLNLKLNNNEYRIIYPKTSVDQVQGINDRVRLLLGDQIHRGDLGATVIDVLTCNYIKSTNNLPITAHVTNSYASNRAVGDELGQQLTQYIHDINPVIGHNDQLRVKTGNEQNKGDIGQIITINYVENAQKDNNNIPINEYVRDIIQDEDDKLTFISGQQFFTHSKGKTFCINHVKNADSAETDKLGNDITKAYAKVDHTHEVEQINNIKEYIDNKLVTLIQSLLIEGKISIVSNAIQMCQYPKYDFQENETIKIPLSKNTTYNRPGPEILKLKDSQNLQTDFTYQYDKNAYIYNPQFIDENGKLITEKKISFGSPRKLASGYISRSGIITLDNLKKINYIIIGNKHE